MGYCNRILTNVIRCLNEPFVFEMDVLSSTRRALRLLCGCWEWLQTVARKGGYYGELFCKERGVTQEDPLISTIFNVVVDTVVRHWESLVL